MHILLGIARLARGNAEGFNQFGATTEAFLASLAPLVAFPLVGGLLMLANGGGLAAIGDLLATLCALLAPPVLSYEVARLWRREGLWLRFAVAFNWCQWAIPIAAVALLTGFGVLIARGVVTIGIVCVATRAAFAYLGCPAKIASGAALTSAAAPAASSLSGTPNPSSST